MDGTIVRMFLSTLNGGFAGYTDWRIPNAKELQSIVDYEMFGPSVAPAFHLSGTCAGCTDVTAATCSCTASSFYWSSTTAQDFPSTAWRVDFGVGGVGTNFKVSTHPVRAVRGGL